MVIAGLVILVALLGISRQLEVRTNPAAPTYTSGGVTLPLRSLLQWKLPEALREVSGIAVVGDRVFTHTDEHAVVYEVDVATGAYQRLIELGAPVVRGDFEGIAFLGAPGDITLYLITSAGLLFELPHAFDERSPRVDFEVWNTGLGDTCEIEGLDAFGPRALVIACKEMVADSDRLHLYEWDAVTRDVRLLVDFARVDKLKPSAVAVHRAGFALLSAKGRQIQIVDHEGTSVVQANLDKAAHYQPEGLGFLPDGRMVIADEGKKGGGRISVYSGL